MIFSNSVRLLLEENGIVSATWPHHLIEQWEQFISTVAGGYSFDISEYDNDISVRGWIELVLKEESLRDVPERDHFRDEVNFLDDRFKKFLVEGIERNDRVEWWERAILRNGGKEYLQDIEQVYGIKL
jgi:hypothetical protein